MQENEVDNKLVIIMHVFEWFYVEFVFARPPVTLIMDGRPVYYVTIQRAARPTK
jgi:hypothetical protein